MPTVRFCPDAICANISHDGAPWPWHVRSDRRVAGRDVVCLCPAARRHQGPDAWHLLEQRQLGLDQATLQSGDVLPLSVEKRPWSNTDAVRSSARLDIHIQRVQEFILILVPPFRRGSLDLDKSELSLIVFWSTPYSFISSQIAICSNPAVDHLKAMSSSNCRSDSSALSYSPQTYQAVLRG